MMGRSSGAVMNGIMRKFLAHICVDTFDFLGTYVGMDLMGHVIARS